jgi:hypothetical protein
MAQGRVQQATTTLIAVLEARFGQIPSEVETKIREVTESDKLQTWTTRAATAATLDDFRKATSV